MAIQLKICGMKLPANIMEVAALKPQYIGFIFYKKSLRFIDGLTPAFVKDLPATLKKTGVFVNEDANKIIALVRLYDLNAVQLHGAESAVYCAELAKELKKEGVELIKAFGIDEAFDFSTLAAFENEVDYFLFDTQSPAHGGSGKTFNWALLQNYTLDQPYFLSGGIGLDSIAQLKTINDERLYAIDVNSKFELAPGLKDIDKLKEFKSKLAL